MQSNTARAAVGAALIAAAVVLFLVLNGGGNGDDSTTSAATQGKGGKAAPVPTIVVKNGKPVGGIRELDYNKGDQIRFRVNSDVGDEVHVHGYDLHKDVTAGSQVQIIFKADITGVFEAELENRKLQILELTVK